MPLPRTVLVGVSGYGARHLEHLRSLHRHGHIVLAALVDPRFADVPDLAADRPESAAVMTGLEQALEHANPDIVVVASPPHTHLALARAVLEHGAALYLEKPPVPRVEDLDELVARRGALRFEVGFQLTRPNVEALLDVWRSGHLGKIRRVSAFGALRRPDSYYERAAWAGRWFLDGRAVLDGPLFNPLAHVVHTALSFLRIAHPGWRPTEVMAECYSVRRIEGDDLTAFRVAAEEGPSLTCAGTTASDEVIEPSVTIYGSAGEATVRHRDGALTVRSHTGTWSRPGPTISSALESAVLDPHGTADELLVPEAVRPFVVVTNGVVEGSVAPRRLHDAAQVAESNHGQRTFIRGGAAAVAATARTGRLFSELSLPWAHPPATCRLTGYDRFAHQSLVS